MSNSLSHIHPKIGHPQIYHCQDVLAFSPLFSEVGKELSKPRPDLGKSVLDDNLFDLLITIRIKYVYEYYSVKLRVTLTHQNKPQGNRQAVAAKNVSTELLNRYRNQRKTGGHYSISKSFIPCMLKIEMLRCSMKIL